MTKEINGVDFYRKDGYALCHIQDLSDELKDILRKNLSSICHGSHVSDYIDSPLYNYKSTLKSFLQRYNKKPLETKKGMIGELLSHVLVTTMFDEYDVASAFFNLEEKSIKKGFDLILYNTQDNTAWITEVKSGNLQKNKSHNQTAKILLAKARDDLDERLNEQEIQYWLNAINHVRATLHDKSDYKDVLLSILRDELGAAPAVGEAISDDKNVILVSSLFSDMGTLVSEKPIKEFSEEVIASGPFHNTFVISIQKGTYENVVEFLQEESEKEEEA